MTELSRELQRWLDEMGKCASCERIVMEEGVVRKLEAAWDDNGDHMVLLWFRSLISGPWEDEPRWMQKKGKDARLRILADLAIRFEDYCSKSELAVPIQLNTLDDIQGLYELKVPKGRVAFYESRSEGKSFRCTHGFYKNQDKTPQVEIARGLAIKRADERR